MASLISVLIVEDEIIVAADLQESLEQEGYHIVGIVNNGLSAVEFIRENDVDLVLLDINIKGDWDGIETSRQIARYKTLPFIYLTAYADDSTFNRARDTLPAAYLLKPFFLPGLRMAIELAFNNFQQRLSREVIKEAPAKDTDAEDPADRDFVMRMQDAIFIRQGGKHIKVKLDEIIYVVADGNHVHIHTGANQYIMRRSMQSLLAELYSSAIMRVHRSYAVNTAMVEKIKDNQLYLGAIQIPLGRNYKETFLDQVKIF